MQTSIIYLFKINVHILNMNFLSGKQQRFRTCVRTILGVALVGACLRYYCTNIIVKIQYSKCRWCTISCGKTLYRKDRLYSTVTSCMFWSTATRLCASLCLTGQCNALLDDCVVIQQTALFCYVGILPETLSWHHSNEWKSCLPMQS